MTVMEAVPSSSLPMQLAEIPKFGERRRAASDPVDTPAKRRCGARFNDEIFQVTVGPTKDMFMVYKHILNASPVLACMTSGPFAESVTKQIVLPDDDAECFGRVLEHLYSNDEAALDFDPIKDKMGLETMAVMYELAEKYQLPTLKKVVTKKIEAQQLNHIQFFQVMHRISQKTSESDEIFLSFFAGGAQSRLPVLDNSEVTALAKMCETAGSFAQKVVELQGRLYRELLAREKWYKDRYVQQNPRAQEDLAKARRMHGSQHPSCVQCHVLVRTD